MNDITRCSFNLVVVKLATNLFGNPRTLIGMQMGVQCFLHIEIIANSRE